MLFLFVNEHPVFLIPSILLGYNKRYSNKLIMKGLFNKIIIKFREKLLDNPYFAFIFAIITLILMYPIMNLRFLLPNSSIYMIDLFLDFMILMVLYAFYALFLIPVVFHLPDGKYSLPILINKLKLRLSIASTKKIILGFIVGIVLLISFLFVDLILGDLVTYSIDFNKIFDFPNVANLGFFNLIQQIRPAFWEEIIFRGILLTILLNSYSERTAIFISSLIFGIFHLANPISFPILNAIYTFFFGIILANLYLKTSNLIPCIIAHYLNNILSTLVINLEILVGVYAVSAILLTVVTFLLRMGIIKLYELSLSQS